MIQVVAGIISCMLVLLGLLIESANVYVWLRRRQAIDTTTYLPFVGPAMVALGVLVAPWIDVWIRMAIAAAALLISPWGLWYVICGYLVWRRG